MQNASPIDALLHLYKLWNIYAGRGHHWMLKRINQDIAHQRFLLGIETHDGFELPWKRNAG